MPSPSGPDGTFGLPLSAKAMICVWTYLVAGGWYSTYMLIGTIGDAWRNGMFGTLESTFVWIVVVMLITSLSVIGMLFYGRFKRKQKDMAKAALNEYNNTGIFIDPKLKFDLAVIPFWIGGSMINVLASLCVLTAAVAYMGAEPEPEALYILYGFIISFFSAVVSYMVSELFANGVLDGKWMKRSMNAIMNSEEAKAVVKAFAEKAGIPASCVDSVYEKVNGIVKAKDYCELTPDEMIVLSKAAEQARAEAETRTEAKADPKAETRAGISGINATGQERAQANTEAKAETGTSAGFL